MVLRAATKGENVPRPRTSIIVAARDRVRATLEYFQPAHEHGPDAADARMVAWLDKLTNLSSSLRAEVSSPEFVKKKETTQLGFIGMDRGGVRSEVPIRK